LKFAELHLKKGASPFVPFVLGINGEKREMIALADVTGNQVLPAGLKAIAERTFECAVFCYDGFITLGDRRSDAVYAIACERGEQKANIFARLYQPKAFLRPFRSLGEEARYGIIDNPLA
jgi:hypothetical protein